MQTPSPKVEDPGNPSVTYFPQTGHTLSGKFRDFWQQHGGLPMFGFPISEPVNEAGIQVQYFERARLELHPDSGGSSMTVTITPLGTQEWAALGGSGK